MTIYGSSGTITCTATVIDMDGNAALDCSAGPPALCTSGKGDPDRYDAHAPVGSVTWKLSGTPMSAACVLNRVDMLPPQAPNQTPYAAQCTLTFTVTHPSEGADFLLDAVYSGGSPPTHQNGINIHTRIEFST
jgi:hypothetical protein